MSYPNNYADYDVDACGDRIRVASDPACEAGRYVLLTVTVTLAETLDAGQGLAACAPFGFTLPQLELPGSPGYTTVSSSSGATLRLTPYELNGVLFERGVIAWLDEGGIPAGESIEFVFGDRSSGGPGTRASLQALQGLLVACYRVREAENPHPPIQKESPRVAVRPAACAIVRGFATPVLGVGEEGSLTLVAEDRYGNRNEGFAGQVEIRGADVLDGLPATVAFSEADRGRKVLSFRPGRAGLFRPIVSSPGGDQVAGPVEVTVAAPEYRLFFGELHAHTELSYDAAGSIDEYYTFARDTACLDFAAATDHMLGMTGRTGYGNTTTPFACHPGGLPGILFERFEGRWRATADAAKRYHDPGRFVTFLGFEFDTSGHIGHRNLYYREDDAPPIEAPGWPLPKGYLGEWGGGRNGIMIIPHHPPIWWNAGVFTDMKGLEIDTVPEEVEPFVEIYSKHGTSEYLHNPRPLRGQIPGHFVRDMLEAGAHIGFVGGSDSHQANPGSSLEDPGPYRTLQYRSGLAAVWAPELTREALWEAFFARRVYATSYTRTILRLSVNGVSMGQSGSAEYPREITAFAASPGFVSHAELIRNGEVIATEPAGGHRKMPADVEGQFCFTDDRPSGRSEDCYYLRVTIHGTERVWSSPVWVSGT